MRRWRLALVVGLAVVVQSYFLSGAFSTSLNLVLIMLLYLSLRHGFSNLLPLAVAAGIALDAISGTVVGARTFLYPALLLLWMAISRSGFELNSRTNFALAAVISSIAIEAGLLIATWLDIRTIVWGNGLLWLWFGRALGLGIFAWILPKPLK